MDEAQELTARIVRLAADMEDRRVMDHRGAGITITLQGSEDSRIARYIADIETYGAGPGPDIVVIGPSGEMVFMDVKTFDYYTEDWLKDEEAQRAYRRMAREYSEPAPVPEFVLEPRKHTHPTSWRKRQ